MKKLLFLLFTLPLLGGLISSCGPKKPAEARDCTVTLVCRDFDNRNGAALKTVEVLLPIGTYVGRDFFDDNEHTPVVEGYYFAAFEGPFTSLRRDRVMLTLYYKAVLPDEYMLTVHYRDVANPGTNLRQSTQKAVSRQTAINLNYLTDNELVAAIEGYDFHSLDPQTQTMDADREVTLFYQRQQFDITVHYRERGGDPDAPLAADMVIEGVEWGTPFNSAFLTEAGAVKSITNYVFWGMSPETLTVTGAATVTALYSGARRPVMMHYRNIEGGGLLTLPSPHTNPRHPEIPFGTVVNKAYLEANGHAVSIEGYRFEATNPSEITVGSSDMIDLLYRRVHGMLTIEYWRVPLDGGAPVLYNSQEHSLPTGTVVVDYDWLQDEELIDETLIPFWHRFESMSPLGVAVVEAGTTVRIYYEPDDVDVTLEFWKGRTLFYAVDVVGIPYGTLISSYQMLVDRGYIDEEKIPEYHIFDEMILPAGELTLTVTEPVSVELYYRSGLMPVTIRYFKGADAPGATWQGDDVKQIMLGTVISGYQDLVDGGYIDDSLIPAGAVFSSMRPVGGVTIPDGGTEIRLFFIE
ncbi:MAG: hypothetical protein FWE10_06770 [Rikenellaceae bacterium]|nr:hypothetical protein [Rikenellaceae bacterium]MCL2692519.1 hypothetical protein [Rikenellaceae bacterium]